MVQFSTECAVLQDKEQAAGVGPDARNAFLLRMPPAVRLRGTAQGVGPLRVRLTRLRHPAALVVGLIVGLERKEGFRRPPTEYPAFDCGTVCNLFWLPGHWIADQLASSRSSRRQLPDFSRLNASGGCREGDSGDPVVHFTKFLQKLPAHFPGRRAWPRK